MATTVGLHTIGSILDIGIIVVRSRRTVEVATHVLTHQLLAVETDVNVSKKIHYF